MVRIPFHLRRAAFIALREQREGAGGERHRGGEVRGLAGQHVLRLADERDDGFRGLLGAGGESGEREAGGGDLHEVAAAYVIEDGGVPREFVFDQLAKARCAGEFLQRPPVLGTLRLRKLLLRGRKRERRAGRDLDKLGRGRGFRL